MEDLDRERELPGCADAILHTLERLGLEWDGTVEYQSTRTAHYHEALTSLSARGLTYECSCSRRERLADGGYPGTCRGGPRRRGPTAIRFRVDDEELVAFDDRVQGGTRFALAERGDVIVKRRDGAFAYQLAVVVDDALQGVTDVVRGADLLDSTPWQLSLQRALALPTPRYAHLPLIVEPGGRKLAKSRRSVALDARTPTAELCTALTLLRQDYPAELKLGSPREVLDWARKSWDPGRFAGVREVCAPP